MKLYKKKDSNNQNFIIVSFFTKNIEYKVIRLINSLEKQNLNYQIFEIPTIHYSKSNKGSSDLNYCLPQLLLNLFEKINLPILFVDADIVFKKKPSLIFELSEKKVDFSIYNWLEDSDNDGYLPFELNIREKDNSNKKIKYFINSVHINLINPHDEKAQLLSSGAVIYFSATKTALSFLRMWNENIKKFPNTVDDQVLDYTYNFENEKLKNLNVFWLNKSYCRYNWWIFSEPIIDHPDDVTPRESDNFEKITKKQRYKKKNVLTRSGCKIDKNHFIDKDNKLILKIENRKLVIVKKLNDEIYI